MFGCSFLKYDTHNALADYTACGLNTTCGQIYLAQNHASTLVQWMTWQPICLRLQASHLRKHQINFLCEETLACIIAFNPP